ncbi:MAG: transporter substrate-binding domain-containing protein [Sarcina sp.]
MKNNIFKKLLMTGISLSLAFGVIGCGGESAGSNLENIKKNGKIVLGTSADYPPYEFHTEIDGKDTIVGFDIAIADEIAKDLGVKVEIQDMEFASLVPALQAGTVDMVISGMNPTKERAEVVDFSKIYYKAKHGILIKAENKDTFKTKDDFNGQAVGVQKGTIQEELANTQMEGTTVKGLGSVPDLVLEVLSGNTAGVVMEVPVASANAKANDKLYVIEDPKFELVNEEEGSAIAVPKGSTELMDAINKTIDRLVAEGKIDTFIVEANDLMEKEQAR